MTIILCSTTAVGWDVFIPTVALQMADFPDLVSIGALFRCSFVLGSFPFSLWELACNTFI